MRKRPFTHQEFKEIYSKVPRLCIDPIVRMQDGIILTLRGEGNGWENLWHLPGGTLLYQESVEEGLVRITEEELGITVKAVKLLGYMEFLEEERERGFGYTVSLGMLCDFVSGEIRTDADATRVAVFGELPSTMIKVQNIFLERHWDEIFPTQV